MSYGPEKPLLVIYEILKGLLASALTDTSAKPIITAVGIVNTCGSISRCSSEP